MSRATSPALIGREAALVHLDAILDALRQDRTPVVVVAGEAGIGKTRLVTDWLDGIGDRATSVVGSCVDVDEGTLPYLPFVQIIRGLRASAGARAPRRDGSLAELLDVVAADRPDRGSTRLVAALVERLRDVADETPLVLVIEDGQWLDRASASVLGALGTALMGSRIATIVTLRTQSEPLTAHVMAVLAELARHPTFERIDLPRLDATEHAALVAAIAGRRPDDAELARSYAWSEGIPFLTEQLLALDAMTGDAVPPSLRDLLLARVAAATPDVQVLLAAAAVGGRVIDETVLGDVVDLPPARRAAAIRAAVGASLLTIEPGAAHDAVAFHHALLREAVLADLLPGERRDVHARWAVALSQRDPNATAAIAEHWDRARRPDRAVDAAVLAARDAAAAFARADAALWYRRAADLVDRIPLDDLVADRPDRVDLLEAAAMEAEFAGERDHAIESLRLALADARVDARPERRMQLQRRLAEIAWQRAHGTMADALIDAALQDVGDDPGPEGVAVIAASAMRLGLRGHLAEARREAERAIRLAGPIGALRAEARARQVLAELVAMDDVDAGVAGLRETAALAASIGDPDVRMEATHDIAWALANAGRYEGALDALEEARRVATEVGSLGELWPLYLARRLEYLVALGRWSEAETVVPDIQASSAWTARFRLARFRAMVGRCGDARSSIDAALAIRPAEDLDIPDRGGVALARASLAACEGDAESVLQLVDAAVPLPGEAAMEADLRGIAIEAASRSARARSGAEREWWIAGAGRHGTSLADLATRAGAAEPVVRAHERTARAWVMAADDPRLADAWRASARSWEALGCLDRAAASAMHEASGLLATRGSRKRAEERLRYAARIAADLGHVPLSTEIAGLARRSRIQVGPDLRGADDDATVVTPADPRGLSPREVQVLALVAAGRTNREIGEILFISPKTAGVHVSAILAKLGVNNRVEAAMLARQLGLPASGDRVAVD